MPSDLERSPKQHGFAEVLGKTSADEFGAKVAVGQKEAVNFLGAKLVEYAQAIILIVEKALIIDIIDIDELDVQIYELVGDDLSVFASVWCREDASSCRCIANRNGVHPSPYPLNLALV